MFPPGVRFLESERQILRLYAAYAATALDVVTSLEDARRSDATARGLLEFTRAMAQVSSIDDVAQVLADSVPEAVRAADATVLTWGADDETLSVQARTSSVRGRAARMGGAAAGGVGIEEPLTVRRSETELIDRLLSGEGVLVVDATTSDTLAKELFSRFGGTAAVIAPLFSGADFLGAVVATYRTETLRRSAVTATCRHASWVWPIRPPSGSRTPSCTTRSPTWPGTTT